MITGGGNFALQVGKAGEDIKAASARWRHTKRTPKHGEQSVWVEKRKTTSEKQLPFGQNTGKEDKDMAQNIEEHSGGVRLQAGTNSIENDKETTKLLPSKWSK